ncbi:unnamed protein product, partial [Brenthis ino]
MKPIFCVEHTNIHHNNTIPIQSEHTRPKENIDREEKPLTRPPDLIPFLAFGRRREVLKQSLNGTRAATAETHYLIQRMQI